MIFSKYDGDICVFESIEEVLEFMKANEISTLDCSLSSEDDFFIIDLI